MEETKSAKLQKCFDLLNDLDIDEQQEVISYLTNSRKDSIIDNIMRKIENKFTIKDCAANFIFRYYTVEDKFKEDYFRTVSSVTFSDIRSFEELKKFFAAWYKNDATVDKIINVWIYFTEDQITNNNKIINNFVKYLESITKDTISLNTIKNNFIDIALSIHSNYGINISYYNIDKDIDGKMYISNKISKTSTRQSIDVAMIID